MLFQSITSSRNLGGTVEVFYDPAANMYKARITVLPKTDSEAPTIKMLEGLTPADLVKDIKTEFNSEKMAVRSMQKFLLSMQNATGQFVAGQRALRTKLRELKGKNTVKDPKKAAAASARMKAMRAKRAAK